MPPDEHDLRNRLEGALAEGQRLRDEVPRLRALLADVLEAVRRGHNPLVLSSRTEHLDRLAGGLSAVEHALILKGGMGKKQWKAITERLASILEGTPRVLLATGSYIGEGFDDSRLDTLFLTMPISWRGTLQQYVGRLHRMHEGKKAVRVFDYVDAQVPMLARMYEKSSKDIAPSVTNWSPMQRAWHQPTVVKIVVAKNYKSNRSEVRLERC